MSATTLSARPTGRKVMLMATCLCDAFFDDVAQATVEVLEHLGCEIVFPPDQTCCGQPAFNGGDWKTTRQILRHTAEVFEGDLPIVVPSGSCAAMLFHGSKLAFEKNEPHAVDGLSGRSWEVCDFIVNGLGVTEWTGGKLDTSISFHHSCHTRGTCSGTAAMSLLNSIEGLKAIPFGESEQCCGFGGTFSVAFPTISTGMGTLKLDHVLAGSPDHLVSGDMSCLMHLRGLAEKAERPVSILHVTQILRDSLKKR